MRNISILIIAIAALVGCAYQGTHPGQVIGDMFTILKDKKVAINVSLPTQGIVYSETQYRVLWLNYQDGRAKYGAVWPAARDDMEKELISSFENIGVSVKSELESDEYRKFYYQYYQDMPKNDKMGLSPNFVGPTIKSYNELYKTDEFYRYAKSLKNKGYIYLVDVTFHDIRVGSTPFNEDVFIRPQFNVLNLETGEILGKRSNDTGGAIPAGTRIGDLHKNDMATIKHILLLSIRATFNGERHWFWNVES